MHRVLIVDDQPENLYVLRTLLHGHGYIVEDAVNGAEALAKAQIGPPDLVISDLLMPVMDGYTLLRNWRADAALRDIPFIVYTATYTEPQDEKLAFDLGADAFIIKPAEPAAFMDRVRGLLHNLDRAGRQRPPAPPDLDALNEYSEVLVRKLHQKRLELDQVNRELSESLERFQVVSRATNDAVWDWNVASGELWWSDSFFSLFGYEPGAIEPTLDAWTSRIHDDDRDRVLASIEAALHDASIAWSDEYRFRRGDDTYVLVLDRGQIIRDSGGHARRMIGAMLDISDRRKLEQDLAEREERFVRQRNALIALAGRSVPASSTGLQAALENMTEVSADALDVARVGIWRLNEDRTLLQCADLFDRSTKQHTSGAALTIANTPYFHALLEAQVIAASDAVTDRRTRELADGYLRPLGIASMLDAPIHVNGRIGGVLCHEHVGAPREWTRDEAVFAVAVGNLVSLAIEGVERQRVESDLRDAQNRLELAVRAGRVALWEWNVRSGELRFSPEWKQQLGFEPQELPDLLSTWQDRVHGEDRERVVQAMQATARGTEPAFEIEHRLQHKDGSYRHLLARGSLLRGDDGAPHRIVGTHVDITQFTELRAQFLQSQKMESVGRLAGGIAHDFNNLLTVINGTADLVLSSVHSEDPLRHDIQQIREAGDRAATLTRQLLAFSRKQFMRPETLQLNSILSQMQPLLARLLGESIHLVIRLSPDLGLVRADPSQIEQVVMNLAVNARDAMPEGGTLTIETSNTVFDATDAKEHPTTTPGAYVMLTVSDTGMGMDEATKERVFEPFFTTKDPSRGTGLGLSTVYGIVQQTGGTIWIYSEPERGTAFKIYLPQTVGAAADRNTAAAPAAGGTETILLVEDNAPVRRLGVRFLQSAGYKVLSAGTGGEALEILAEHAGPVHLVLTDVVMPGMSGRELATRLAESHPDIKVVFTSGYTEDAVLRHGLVDNPAHFIAKPYTVGQLRAKVREALEAGSGTSPA